MRPLWLLAFVAVLCIAAGAAVRFVSAEGDHLKHSSRNDEPAKAVIKSEPLRPYPNAVRVNLLIHDKAPAWGNGGAQSSNPRGIDLDSSQRVEFEQALQKMTLIKNGDADEAVGAACFDPHHFFRYFDGSGRKVGETSVCFCCNNSRMEPDPIEATNNVWSAVSIEKAESFVKKLGLPTNIHCPQVEDAQG